MSTWENLPPARMVEDEPRQFTRLLVPLLYHDAGTMSNRADEKGSVEA